MSTLDGTRLLTILGRWQTPDSGRVVCPTGVRLAYGEEMTIFRQRESDLWLHYQHRAWRIIDATSDTPARIGETLHAEYGFIRALRGDGDGDGERVEATFTMNSGRAESARGTLSGDGESVRLSLLSEHFLNDRLGVVRTRREYVFSGLGTPECRCEKSMELQTDRAWPELQHHLRAELYWVTSAEPSSAPA